MLFNEAGLFGQKPRLGQTLATESRIGALNTRQPLRHSGLRAIASAGRVGCWVWSHWRAASALAAPLIRDQVYADSAVVNYSDDKILQALTVGLSTLVGGLTGAALGVDVTSAGLAAQNEAINNATSMGPARGVAARENARLIKLCEPNCTEQNFRDIDTQVRTKVEAAATLARLNNLTPEQTLKLADTLSNLLPYYGSAAMLYQAVTGQTLSGQDWGLQTGGCQGFWGRFRRVRRPMARSASSW